MQELFYYDGEFYEKGDSLVHLEDRAFQMGDGIFEVLPVYDGKVFAMPQHIARYTKSMRDLVIPIVDPDEDIINVCQELINRSGIEFGQIYIQISRGHWPRQLNYPVQCFPHIAMTIRENLIDIDAQEHGIACSLEEDIRGLRCDLPTLNRMGNAIAMESARSKRCQNAVLYRKDTNQITEAANANFFIYREGILWTHPANNLILPGITRELILKELLQKLDITAVEKAVTPEFAYGAEEAFITATDMEIQPVIRLNNHKIGEGTPGSVTKKILAAFQDYVDVELSKLHFGPKETEISEAVLANTSFKN